MASPNLDPSLILTLLRKLKFLTAKKSVVNEILSNKFLCVCKTTDVSKCPGSDYTPQSLLFWRLSAQVWCPDVVGTRPLRASSWMPTTAAAFSISPSAGLRPNSSKSQHRGCGCKWLLSLYFRLLEASKWQNGRGVVEEREKRAWRDSLSLQRASYWCPQMVGAEGQVLGWGPYAWAARSCPGSLVCPPPP